MVQRTMILRRGKSAMWPESDWAAREMKYDRVVGQNDWQGNVIGKETQTGHPARETSMRRN